ncbi:MAG: hypothetical protein MJ211_05995 [Bacteroidales bacterium]|nr:hypothetical protein [Bacteroidales bacterium]
MKKKGMSLLVKFLIFVIVFAIGGYFFYKYMPQNFKNIVSPQQDYEVIIGE